MRNMFVEAIIIAFFSYCRISDGQYQQYDPFQLYIPSQFDYAPSKFDDASATDPNLGRSSRCYDESGIPQVSSHTK